MIFYALALAYYAQRRKTAAKLLQIFQTTKFFRKKKPLCLYKWRFCEEIWEFVQQCERNFGGIAQQGGVRSYWFKYTNFSSKKMKLHLFNGIF